MLAPIPAFAVFRGARWWTEELREVKDVATLTAGKRCDARGSYLIL